MCSGIHRSALDLLALRIASGATFLQRELPCYTAVPNKRLRDLVEPINDAPEEQEKTPKHEQTMCHVPSQKNTQHVDDTVRNGWWKDDRGGEGPSALCTTFDRKRL